MSGTPLWLPTAAAPRSCVRCRPRPRVRLHVRSTSPRGDPARRPSKSRRTDGTTDPRRVPAASGEAPGGEKGSLYTSWPASPTRSGAGAWPSASMSAAGRSPERTYIVVRRDYIDNLHPGSEQQDPQLPRFAAASAAGNDTHIRAWSGVCFFRRCQRGGYAITPSDHHVVYRASARFRADTTTRPGGDPAGQPD